MPDLPFADRTQAGQILAERLQSQAGAEALVLGLPRGGVPVAAVVARSLQASLDVMIVRKLGVPGHAEFAMGAIASGDVTVLDEHLTKQLRLDDNAVQSVIDSERRELSRRETAYRGSRPYPDLHERRVILVDDGIATGASMRAAIRAVRRLGAEQCILAVPVAPAETLEALAEEVDQIVCLATPDNFSSVGRWYRDFEQTTDAEVHACLAEQGTSG